MSWSGAPDADDGEETTAPAAGHGRSLKKIASTQLDRSTPRAADNGGESALLAPAGSGEAADADDEPDEPEDSHYWADYATAAYGVEHTPKGA
jgi:hypothetical protein